MKLPKKLDPRYKKVGRMYVKVCPCGNELLGGFNQGNRKYCSISCSLKYNPHAPQWRKDMTRGQQNHWNSIHVEKSDGDLKSHGERFRFAFDECFGILYCDLKIIAGAVPAFRGT